MKSESLVLHSVYFGEAPLDLCPPFSSPAVACVTLQPFSPPTTTTHTSQFIPCASLVSLWLSVNHTSRHANPSYTVLSAVVYMWLDSSLPVHITLILDVIRFLRPFLPQRQLNVAPPVGGHTPGGVRVLLYCHLTFFSCVSPLRRCVFLLCKRLTA